jgi:hypothetical protein
MGAVNAVCARCKGVISEVSEVKIARTQKMPWTQEDGIRTVVVAVDSALIHARHTQEDALALAKASASSVVVEQPGHSYPVSSGSSRPAPAAQPTYLRDTGSDTLTGMLIGGSLGLAFGSVFS